MKIHKPDKGLIIIIFALLISGLVILFCASTVISRQKTGNPYYYLFHQLLYGVIPGLILFFVCQKINYKFWKKISLILFFACLVLMILVFVPGLGYGRGEAQRWLIVGPLSLQPSEFLKLGFIIYLAAFFSKTQKINTLIPFLVILILAGGLVALQSDAGTLGLIAIIAFIIYFLSGAKTYQWITVIVCYILGFFILIKFFPYRMARFITFLNPSVDPQGISYQINQALLGIGSGGLFGLGLGHSQQKYNYLPEVMGDSIFAILAEEIGFFGSLIFISLVLILTFKGLRIAKKSSDNFAKLLAVGITSWLVIQTLINIAVISGLMPLTGIPLPFVSYGGSALISILAATGILVNISKHTT
ncbi:MAG: putative lipid II flippase FtsW [Candidatus Portnoybacteria bacterium CG10_big_fil_rev_8_21_14_0_10_38_18]|uniref:Probable peptidoglycan glycosyltransferase FtsW n=1 Tax=Candidatus Portnoybacteria bacterium CG10_big_fil_rev_8_21_14_0_10_38_18 TaxID=1974813 RepID=A0A2M8KCQ4_9BACT|nr:MAG: putative lipid II flippase FtsW [Candidatus Portnoybacteria bacterium CG10_big_fil_rev_8_21_14_0_10_38_18]